MFFVLPTRSDPLGKVAMKGAVEVPTLIRCQGSQQGGAEKSIEKVSRDFIHIDVGFISRSWMRIIFLVGDGYGYFLRFFCGDNWRCFHLSKKNFLAWNDYCIKILGGNAETNRTYRQFKLEVKIPRWRLLSQGRFNIIDLYLLDDSEMATVGDSETCSMRCHGFFTPSFFFNIHVFFSLSRGRQDYFKLFPTKPKKNPVLWS